MKSLTTLLNEYLILRRAMGFSLIRHEFELKQFLKFMKKNQSKLLKNKLSIDWATKSGFAKGSSGSRRLAILIQFAQYAKSENDQHEVPQKLVLPRVIKNKKVPYIYLEEEVLAMMKEASMRTGIISGKTYCNLIGLLSCTGMRVGEAIQINREDLKLSENKLIIKKDKRGGSREVLLDITSVKALKEYENQRAQVFSYKKDDSFFISNSGQRLNYNNVAPNIQNILKKMGLYNLTVKPTIHDLRHTFAINTVRRWYYENKNVEAKLAALSTYLGHVSPASTYWYLTATKELMACASKQLNKKMGELI